MNLSNFTEELFSSQTIYICLAVYVVTYFIRRILEGTWKILVESGRVKNNHLAYRIWSEILLPIVPILVGGAMGLMAKFIIWPDITNGNVGGRILYGAVCGMFSSFIFSRIRGFLKSAPTRGANEEEDEKVLPPALGITTTSLVEPPK
jgi:Na+-translocating ferredoxin:NAD+ oxidoreductase RnfD subunit